MSKKEELSKDGQFERQRLEGCCLFLCLFVCCIIRISLEFLSFFLSPILSFAGYTSVKT